MKVSGSEQVDLKETSRWGMQISEKVEIDMTVKKLSEEGKHVINVIHGSESVVLGFFQKTLTFLWEADDEDPIYKKYLEETARLKQIAEEEEKAKQLQAQELKRKQQQAEERRNELREEREYCINKINELAERIAVAKGEQKPKYRYSETITKKKKEKDADISHSACGIILFVVGILLVLFSMSLESKVVLYIGIICIILGVICLSIRLRALMNIQKKYPSKEEIKKQDNERFEKDKQNIPALEQELKRIEERYNKLT